MHRRTPQIALLALILGLFCVGCRTGAGSPERRLDVPHWAALLPGRAETLDVSLPVHLDARLPHARSEYVLRAKVDLPPDMQGKPLTLAIPYMTAIATLHVDGAEAVPIDASILDRDRATNPPRWRIPGEAGKDGKLSMELRVAHVSSRSGWIDSVPVLTTDPRGGATLAAVHAFNEAAATFALAGGVIVGILYGILFVSLRDRRRAAHGWFALGASCGIVYPAFLLGLTQPPFRMYEAPFMTVSLVLGSIAAMHFARAYFGQPPPHRLWWFVLGVVFVVAVLAHDPFVSILVMGPVVVLVTLANAFAQLVFLVRWKRQGAKPTVSDYGITFAWPAAVLLGLPDVLAWLGQGEPTGGVRTACLGIMALSLYQGAALSRELLVSLKHADDLNAELGERIRLLQSKHKEVELLNDELRRQIALRSRALAEKLAQMPDDEVTELPELQPGDVVEGRYKVVKQLGSGGMGTVYEVVRVADGRHLALKALAAGGDAQQRARFAREAQIVAGVSHANVVSIVDVDVAKSGFIFLVMELVEEGATLHEVRRRHRDVAWTLGVLAQVAEGIDAIHGSGIIHRDLKPGNILLSRGADGRRPIVKITDFGISALAPEGGRVSSASMARARPIMDSLPPVSEIPGYAPLDGLPAIRVSELEAQKKQKPSTGTMLIDLDLDPEAVADTIADVPSSPDPATVAEGAVKRASSDRPKTPQHKDFDEPLTETGIIFGTPQYMAQELSAGTKHATRAVDVFALGIIAFELLTGKRPFPEAPVSAKLHGRPLPIAPSFRQMVPTLLPEISALLDRAMNHDPKQRPTAKELATALRAAADRMAP